MNKSFQTGAFGVPSVINTQNQYRQNIRTATDTRTRGGQNTNTAGTFSAPLVELFTRSNRIHSLIAPYVENVTLSVGDYVQRPDGEIDDIYFPETAVISEYEILNDGRIVGISLHARDSILGLSSIFDVHPADSWTQVLLAGSAYKIKSKIFRDQLARHEDLQTFVFEHVNNHIRQLTQRIVCNSYHSIEERFCTLLLRLQDYRKGSDITITQEQIAQFLGVHRPSVTQTALSLRARKIINYARAKLMVIDYTGLEELACDCYRH